MSGVATTAALLPTEQVRWSSWLGGNSRRWRRRRWRWGITWAHLNELCVLRKTRALRLWIESNKLVTMPSRNVNMWMSIMCAARCVERNLMMGRRGKWNGHPICWLFAMLWITTRQQRASSWFFLFFGSGARRKECEIYIHYRGGFMCVSHLSSYIRWKSIKNEMCIYECELVRIF